MNIHLMPVEQWAESVGRSPRWAREHAASGDILAIKIGGSYFITPELVAAMSVRAIPAAQADADTEGWGQISRTAS